MPSLSQEMSPEQAATLSTKRTISSINDKNKTPWQYPSPQVKIN
jgi:hypothetical protein